MRVFTHKPYLEENINQMSFDKLFERNIVQKKEYTLRMKVLCTNQLVLSLQVHEY